MMKINQIFDAIDKLEEAHILLAALELKLFTILKKNYRRSVFPVNVVVRARSWKFC